MKWVNAVHELTVQPSPNILNWLVKPYVLSQALRQVCTALTVNVLSQQRVSPFFDEHTKLNLTDNDLPLVREVLLEGDGIPFTYGRVVVPTSTYQTYFKDFDTLGSQPIGEKLLYNNPNSRRGAFEYAIMEVGSPASLSLFLNLNKISQQTLWGRRSVFTLGHSPLLVSEFFLPTLPEYPEQ